MSKESKCSVESEGGQEVMEVCGEKRCELVQESERVAAAGIYCMIARWH